MFAAKAFDELAWSEVSTSSDILSVCSYVILIMPVPKTKE